MVFFGALRFNKNLMAEDIHHVERIKSAVIFDVPRPHEISLVNIVNCNRFGKIWILDPFRNV